jgi:hypothetical protein
MDELEQPVETLDSDAAAAAAEDHDQKADQHDGQSDAASQEQAEDDEEVEIGDKKFALPKSAAAELKAGMMRNADYTQKTQAVAAERKAVETEREQVRQHAEQQQQYIKEIAKVTAIDDQLSEYAKLDWSALSDQDPVGAQKLHFQYQALQQQRAQAADAVTRKQHENALAEQQELAKQVQDADAYFKREIPGWSNERSDRLQKFAVEAGLPSGEKLAKMVIQNPALAKVLHKAELYDQLEKKQGAKQQTKPAAPPAPVTRVSASRATAAKDPDKMPMEDWVKWRAEQRRKR